MSIDPNTATCNELRDWLARDAGWGLPGDRAIRGDGILGTLTMYVPPRVRNEIGELPPARASQPEHPYPPTLDGAATALPKECSWFKLASFKKGTAYIEWYSPTYDNTLRDTGDEIRDRYALAVACRLAMKEANNG